MQIITLNRDIVNVRVKDRGHVAVYMIKYMPVGKTFLYIINRETFTSWEVHI